MEKLRAFWARAVPVVRNLSYKSKRKFPAFLQYAGLGVVATGFFVLAPWLGLVVAGVAMCFVGWSSDGEE
jgi:hypothetical protein